MNNIIAIIEARMASKRLPGKVMLPANGKPIIVPSQDMILGLYYMSLEREGQIGQGMAFSSVEEVEHALHQGVVSLHSKVTARVEQVDDEGQFYAKRYETTPGRVRLSSVLPKNKNAPFDMINRVLRKKEVGAVIDTVYRHCGQKESVIFCDQITWVRRKVYKSN